MSGEALHSPGIAKAPAGTMNAFTVTAPTIAPVVALASAARLVRDAEWLAQGFDSSGRAMHFVNVPRQELHDLSFLTDQALRECARRTIGLDLVEQSIENLEQVPVHYIFHTAFCGSTLLARALEALGAGASLKEPGLLTNLLYYLGRWNDGDDRRRIGLAVDMLARRVGEAPATIVKPSCFASSLAPALLAARPSSRAIFLSGELRDFLAAVAKRSIRGRTWARRAYADAMRHMPLDFNFTPSDVLELSDLQIAGLAWLTRTHFLRQSAASLGPDRVLQLSFADLVHAPQSTLSRAAQFLGAEVSKDLVRQTLAGPVIALHAKQAGLAYTMADRDKEMRAALATHGEEIETVAAWVEAIGAGSGLQEPAGQPARSAH